MKKRIIALFMASVMAFTIIGCGSKSDDNAKEAEALLAEIEELKAENAELKAEEKVEDTATEEVENASEEVEEVAEEEVAEEEPTDPTALYGTKKAKSVKVEGSKIPGGLHAGEGTYEYTDNGYNIKFVDGANDYIYYYDNNDNVYKYIIYEYGPSYPDGLINNSNCGLGMGPILLYTQRVELAQKSINELYEIIDYDESGRPVALKFGNGDLVADYTYDANGRVASFNRYGSNELYELEYSDDKVVLNRYQTIKNYYNEETRETEELHKECLNTYTGYFENGKLTRVVLSTEKSGDINETDIEYNEYGYVSRISGEYDCTLEYVYE